MEVLSSRILLRPADLSRSQHFYRDVLGLAVYREFGSPADPGVVSATVACAFGCAAPHEPAVAGLPFGPMQMYVLFITANVSLPPDSAISLPCGREN